MKIGELFVQLGVKADTFTVRDFGRAIADLPFAVAGAITSLTGMSIGFVEMTKHTMELSNNLSLFRAETGLSTDELQRWQAVAKQVGLSGDLVTNSVMRISNALAQMRLGHMDQGFLVAMSQLGVNMKGKNAFQILQDIASRAKGMNPQVATAALANMGLSPELMKIFTLGPGQFDRMARGGVVMNNRDIEAMQDFQQAIGRFSLVIEKTFVPAITQFEPYMQDFTEVMSAVLGQLAHLTSYSLGETSKFLNSIRKQGGFSAFMENLANSSLTPGMLHNPKYVHNEFDVTQHIHSTADAEDVARESAKHLRHEHARALKQFNNAGY